MLKLKAGLVSVSLEKFMTARGGNSLNFMINTKRFCHLQS